MSPICSRCPFGLIAIIAGGIAGSRPCIAVKAASLGPVIFQLHVPGGRVGDEKGADDFEACLGAWEEDYGEREE